ncbi:hypothetical protein EPR50_G00187360 [Xyrichtys novacula]|uniref:Uncharacterized protein n=1 Tax=Xyrichtys novacula TaxID=13765 RepID=A0AAV1GWL9_XYRNO|nr:hypothetical protein EPR50_G00187360 [Xyrichtys novacula]
MAANDDSKISFSTECVDDIDGFQGVIVYDDLTFLLSPPQEAEEGYASGEEQDHNSSVQTFNCANDEHEETDTLRRTKVKEENEGEEEENSHLKICFTCSS